MISIAAEPAPTRRLVIVEDEAILALDIERHLTSLGFDVRGVAADAETAVRLVERENPDLVLMDIHLQGSRDGVETAALLRERFDVPVVYLTAHSDPKTMERAQATEPMGYLLKPFKKPDLQNVVTIALARSANERRLRRREQTLRTTLSCIDEAIFTTDADGLVTYLNDAAEQLVGRVTAQAVSQPLSVVVPLRSTDGAVIQGDPVRNAQQRGRVALEGTLAREGGDRNVVGTAAALRHGTQNFGVVLALRDLTELLLARKQLEFAERLSSMGTLAAGVSHEVNNPLSVVLANLEFALSAQPSLPADVREALSEARDAAQRVARIVGELRAFSGPQSAQLAPIDPCEILSAALSFTRAHWRSVAGVALDLRAVPTVLASSPRLVQVVVNLVINAVHALELVDHGPRGLGLSSFTDERGRAVLVVSDTGPGVREALRERIFEPFFTTKGVGEGTGLGLAVSRSIVESHGGHLSVGPGPGGVGTSFSLALPPVQNRAPEAALRALWVGAPCAESEALGRVADCLVAPGDVSALRERIVARRPEVTLLALPAVQARALSAEFPEYLTHLLYVGDAQPAMGELWLRIPFDPRALAAYVRRGGAAG